MAPVGLSLLGNRLAEAMSSGEIKFTYLDGTVISGRFEVEGVLTVTTSDGRFLKADARKVLLLQMHKNNESWSGRGRGVRSLSF
jgi:hypothetical protein